MSKPETAKTAHGTRGGSTPGEVGERLVYDIEEKLGAAPGVVMWRNAVMGATLKSGRSVLTGIGGKGAPDLFVEVKGADDEWRSVWMECKAGTGELNPHQVKWHDAAKLMKRHVFKVKSVEEAVAIVARFQAVRAEVVGSAQGVAQ